MTKAEIGRKYASLSEAEKTALVVDWLYELGMAARGTYVAGEEGVADPILLRRISELQLHMVKLLRRLLNHEPEHYPPAEYCEALLEDAELAGCDVGVRRISELHFSPVATA